MIEKQDIIKLLKSKYNTASSEEERNLLIELMDDLDALEEIQSMEEILHGCLLLLKELNDVFNIWLAWEDIHPEEEERFSWEIPYFRIVNSLFLLSTDHAGGNSTRELCKKIGVDSSEEIRFKDYREDLE